MFNYSEFGFHNHEYRKLKLLININMKMIKMIKDGIKEKLEN